MGPAVVELEAGADDQLADRARHQQLSGAGQGADPGADVDRHPEDVVAYELDLTGVDPDPDLQPDRRQFVADRGGAADRPGRAVEGGQEPVPHRLDLSPAVDLELAADD